MKKFVVLLVASSAAFLVSAQGAPKAVGKLTNVQGFVTIAGGGQLANAVSGAALIVGNRIITTSGGGVTLAYDNGCSVTLKANESFTVQANSDCSALLASVGSVGGPAPAAVGASPNLLVAGGMSAAAALLQGSGSGSTGSIIPSLSAKGIVFGGWVPNSSH